MRVKLIGASEVRARLRQELGEGIDVVGEFSTIAAARASATAADALVMATGDDHERLPEEPLTPREIEVLEEMAEGLSNKAIAARLGISDQTVKFHVAAICGKLGAANRTEAVRRAIRRGLVAV
jgi:two-component system nitrate/nitrite response regulator NarL